MCNYCEWEEFYDEIDELMEDSDFDFAFETLDAIREWVQVNEHCTTGQRTAVDNIVRGAGR